MKHAWPRSAEERLIFSRSPKRLDKARSKRRRTRPPAIADAAATRKADCHENGARGLVCTGREEGKERLPPGVGDSLLGVRGRNEKLFPAARRTECCAANQPGTEELGSSLGRPMQARDPAARLRLAHRDGSDQTLRGRQFLALLQNGSRLCHWKASDVWMFRRSPHSAARVGSIFRAKRAEFVSTS